MSRRKAQLPGQLPSSADDDNATAPTQSEPAAGADSDLPNAIDIDAKAIKAPVLTKQGWVCPDETGQRPPDAMKA